jgi:renalase
LAQREFSHIMGEQIEPNQALCHRWLYASFNPGLAAPGLLTDAKQMLVLAGDWSLGGRVENAFLAGSQAADLLLSSANMPVDLSAV